MPPLIKMLLDFVMICCFLSFWISDFTFFRSKAQENIGWFHLHSRYLVQILDHSFELLSSLLSQEATKTISEPVFQIAVKLINIHLIPV